MRRNENWRAVWDDFRNCVADVEAKGEYEFEQQNVGTSPALRRGLAHGRCRSKKAQITSGPLGSLGDGPNNRGWRRYG